MSQQPIFQPKTFGYVWINYMCSLGSRMTLYFWKPLIVFPELNVLLLPCPSLLLAQGSRDGSWETVSSGLTHRKRSAGTATYTTALAAGPAATTVAAHRPETLSAQNLLDTGGNFRLSFQTKDAAKHLSLPSAFCSSPHPKRKQWNSRRGLNL